MFCIRRKCKKENQQTIEPKEVKKDQPKDPALEKAKEVAEKYSQLKECCEILSRLEYSDSMPLSTHSQGWRVWEHTVRSAGVDVNEIYSYIKLLTRKRKAELETKLENIST